MSELDINRQTDKSGSPGVLISGTDLKHWNIDEEIFWTESTKKIAFRNLFISVPCLLCAFAVWMLWGVLTVQMLNLGFPFTKEQLFTLSSIAGLSGATLRIPNTFFIRLMGGRNTIFFTTSLLLIPVIGTGTALMDINTPLWVFQLYALLSGIGGGNFASSMSNISYFFPRKMQGLSLGLNAGIGNFGVTTMQVLIPLAMLLGLPCQTGLPLKAVSGTLFGTLKIGTEIYIENGAFVWLLFLIPLCFLSWFGMNNIRDEHVSPDIDAPLQTFAKMSVMLGIGLLTSVLGLYFMLPTNIGGSGLIINKWIILPIVLCATIYLLKLLPGEIKTNLNRQYKIFGNVHTWVQSIIYTMTFGSFIGYAAALPLAIQVIFGFSHILNSTGTLSHDTINPNAPNALMYAWIGPFVGAAVRPLGGWLADKYGGVRVTQVASILMIITAFGAAHYMKLAYASATPEQYFMPFFMTFMVLFCASGVGNGSVFRTIAVVFNKEQSGPVLGWTSAVAAYGAFIIPKEFGEQITAGNPEYALFGFAAFYVICLILNWIFYLRPGNKFANA